MCNQIYKQASGFLRAGPTFVRTGRPRLRAWNRRRGVRRSSIATRCACGG